VQGGKYRRQKGYGEGQGPDLRPIPKPINVARYCAEEPTAIDQFNIELESTAANLAEPEDGHDEEGVFAKLDKVRPYLAFFVAVGVLTILLLFVASANSG
jgi:hypothetical protein